MLTSSYSSRSYFTKTNKRKGVFYISIWYELTFRMHLNFLRDKWITTNSSREPFLWSERLDSRLLCPATIPHKSPLEIGSFSSLSNSTSATGQAKVLEVKITQKKPREPYIRLHNFYPGLPRPPAQRAVHPLCGLSCFQIPFTNFHSAINWQTSGTLIECLFSYHALSSPPSKSRVYFKHSEISPPKGTYKWRYWYISTCCLHMMT